MKVERILFYGIVGLLGAFAVLSGVDTGVGGMETLGLQGLPAMDSFMRVTDESTFSVVESHQRFRSGLWLGIGLLILFSLLTLKTNVKLLHAAFALVVVGGLVRFAQGDFAVLFGPQIGPILIIELILVPLLFVWSLRVVKGLSEENTAVKT